MIISMYRDTAAGYGLCKDDGRDDNSITLDVPRRTMEAYYNDTFGAYDDNPTHTFDRWIQDEYILDDMEGLLEYIQDTEGDLSNVKLAKMKTYNVEMTQTFTVNAIDRELAIKRALNIAEWNSFNMYVTETDYDPEYD